MRLYFINIQFNITQTKNLFSSSHSLPSNHVNYQNGINLISWSSYLSIFTSSQSWCACSKRNSVRSSFLETSREPALRQNSSSHFFHRTRLPVPLRWTGYTWKYNVNIIIISGFMFLINLHVRKRISSRSPAHQIVGPPLSIVKLHLPFMGVSSTWLHGVLRRHEYTHQSAESLLILFCQPVWLRS